MPDAVISNTTPILYLHKIGRIELLKQLYGQITIPEQVVSELAAGGIRFPEGATTKWAMRKSIPILKSLQVIPDLGLGEAGAISLALENPGGSLLLLDDKLARRIANLNRLKVTGTAGVLLKAKEKGLISEVKSLLGDLIGAGFYLRKEHQETLCRLAGERFS
jgi:predicted nucleic acid-binding protein